MTGLDLAGGARCQELAATRECGPVLQVGTGVETTVREMIAAIGAHLGLPKLALIPLDQAGLAQLDAAATTLKLLEHLARDDGTARAERRE